MQSDTSPWKGFPKFYENEIESKSAELRTAIAASEAKAAKKAKKLSILGAAAFLLWALMKWGGMVEALSWLGDSSQSIYLVTWIASFIVAVVFLISGGEDERKEGNAMVLGKVIQFRGWEHVETVEEPDELKRSPLFGQILNSRLSKERTATKSIQVYRINLTNHVKMHGVAGLPKVWEVEVDGKGTHINDRSSETEDREFDLFKGVFVEFDLGADANKRVAAISRKHVGGMKDMTVKIFGKLFDVTVCNEKSESEFMVFGDDHGLGVSDDWIQELEGRIAKCDGGVGKDKRLGYFLQSAGKAHLALDCDIKVFEMDLVQGEEALEPLKTFFDGVEELGAFLAKA